MPDEIILIISDKLEFIYSVVYSCALTGQGGRNDTLVWGVYARDNCKGTRRGCPGTIPYGTKGYLGRTGDTIGQQWTCVLLSGETSNAVLNLQRSNFAPQIVRFCYSYYNPTTLNSP